MSFLAIKQNPFEAYGEQWAGAGKRAEEAAQVAATVANGVLADKVRDLAGRFDRFDDDLTSKIGIVHDRKGRQRVGLVGATAEEERRAREAEYGDEEHAPQPLMRVAQRAAEQEAQEAFSMALNMMLWAD